MEAKYSPYSEICGWCKHHDTSFEHPNRCKAFKQIPLEIWEGKNDHTKPYPGDNGIIFQRKPKYG